MWQNFNTKQGTQKKNKKNNKKNGRYGNPQHTYFTNGIYFVQKNYITSLRILSSLHKATKSHIFMMQGALMQLTKKSIICTMIEQQICGGIMFLPYAVEDNIEKKPELNVLNESLT